jgi:hypothetical protein
MIVEMQLDTHVAEIVFTIESLTMSFWKNPVAHLHGARNEKSSFGMTDSFFVSEEHYNAMLIQS